MSDIKIPEAVMERIHAELAKTIMESPDYINKIVTELMTEPGRGNGYHDPEHKLPYFERILRRELRTMIETNIRKALHEHYSPYLNQVITEQVKQLEHVEGSLAYVFAKMLEEEYKIKIDVKFQFENTRD